MLIDRHIETYVEENTLPQQNIRRLANGSIDYTFYDVRARSIRGVAFRAAGWAVKVLVLKSIDRLVGNHPEAQQASRSKARQMQAQTRLRRADKRLDTVSSSRKPISEAA